MSSQLIGLAVPPKTPTRIQSNTATQRLGWYTPQNAPATVPHPPGSSLEIAFRAEKLHSLTDRLNSAYMSRSHSETSQLRDYFPDTTASSQVAGPPPTAMHSQAHTAAWTNRYDSSQPMDGARYSRPSSTGPPSSAVAADYSGHPYSDASQPRSIGQQHLYQPTPAYSSVSSAMSQLRDSAHGPGTNVQAAPGLPVEVLPVRPVSVPAPPPSLHPPPASASGSTLATSGICSTRDNASVDNSSSVPSHILAALEDTRTVYELSRGELENLVARVIREDGFVSLVRDRGSTKKAE